MSKLAAVPLVLCLSVVSAMAQTGDGNKRAVAELASELQVCSVYFRIAWSCLSGQEPAVARTYGEMSDKAANLAISTFRGVGVSDEVYLRRSSEPIHRGDDERDAGRLHEYRRAAAEILEILSASKPRH